MNNAIIQAETICNVPTGTFLLSCNGEYISNLTRGQLHQIVELCMNALHGKVEPQNNQDNETE